MPENPIIAIENAELTAKQVVQQAIEEKAALIHNAQKEAEQDLEQAVLKATREGGRILKEAEQVSRDAAAALDSSLEAEKKGLSRKAVQNEAAAINAILEIVSGNTSS